MIAGYIGCKLLLLHLLLIESLEHSIYSHQNIEEAELTGLEVGVLVFEHAGESLSPSHTHAHTQ